VPELEKAPESKKYQLIKIIGKGTYSTVYLSSLDKKMSAPTDEPTGFPTEINEEDFEIVSQLSEILQCSKSVSQQEINESIVNFENQENVEYQALKMIQCPNFNKEDETYKYQKTIFMNDAVALQAIQGHKNIVKLIEVIPEGIVETAETSSGGSQKLHVDYAMAIECLKGGELYFNMQKFGRFEP
jgi:serine/threonine protein kinase